MFLQRKQNTVVPSQNGKDEDAVEVAGPFQKGGSLSLEEVESQAPERESCAVNAVPRPLSVTSYQSSSSDKWQFGNLPVTVISHIFAFLQDGDTLSCGTVNLQWFAALNFSEKDIFLPVAREWVVAEKAWAKRKKWLRGTCWAWFTFVIVLFYLWFLFFTTVMAAVGITMGEKWDSPALTRFGWDGVILTIAEYSLVLPWCFTCCCKCLQRQKDLLYKTTITLFSLWYLSVYIVLMVRLGSVRKENAERWNLLWPTFALWGPLAILGSMTIGPVVNVLDRDKDPGTLREFLAKKNSTAYRNGEQQTIVMDQPESELE